MPADPAGDCLKKARRLAVLAGPDPDFKGEIEAGSWVGPARETASLAQERELIVFPRVSLAPATEEKQTDLMEVPVFQARAAKEVAGASAVFQEVLSGKGLLTGLAAFSLADLASRGRYLHIRNTLFQIIKDGAVPLVFLNPTTAGEEAHSGQTAELAALLAPLLKADLLLCLGRGFSTKDSQTLGKAAPNRVPVSIPELGVLIPGEPVIFDPGRWEALTLASRGGIVVSRSFAQRLDQENPSPGLSLEDTREVKGRFDSGSQVNLVDREGKVLAVGLSNYSSARLNSLKSLKPDDIRDKLGYKYYCYVIQEENITLPLGEGGPACLLPARQEPAR